jgi:hypothetical protein
VTAGTPANTTTGTASRGTAATSALADHTHKLGTHDHSSADQGGAIPIGSVTDLGVFAAWSPTLRQLPTSTNVSKTVDYGRFTQAGKLVVASTHLSVTGSGTDGFPVSLTVPVAPATPSGKEVVVGYGTYFKNADGRYYPVHVALSGGALLVRPVVTISSIVFTMAA